MKRLLSVVLLGASSLLSGCIAWEIRDEMRAVNQNLCEVKPALVHTLHSVEETNLKIAQTQAQLAEVQTALAVTQAQLTVVHASIVKTDQDLVGVGGTLGKTNPQLVDMQGELERMRILSDVHAKLTDVNKALGPLSSAMGSLGGAMSFLGMSGESSPDLLAGDGGPASAAAPATAGGEADAADVAAVAGAKSGGGGGGDASKRPDPLLGTWVLVYPPPVAAGAAEGAKAGAATPRTVGRITVVTGDGKFLTAEDGKSPRTGKWSRKGRMLTFDFDAVGGAATAGAAQETETVELLTLNSRTMTVRKGDTIRVHARP